MHEEPSKEEILFDDYGLALQPASEQVYRQKYQLTSFDGKTIDNGVMATFRRVARALAQVEPCDKEVWFAKFLDALVKGATPAGRIMSNAGASKFKPRTSLINCVVSDTIPDSIGGIYSKLTEAAISLSAGCGIGYDFSSLRPKGAYVNGVGAQTSGALGFMASYNSMCFTIASAGGRRGAQMGTMDIRHPDVLDFISAKRQDGALRQFNLSLLITDEFMRCVERKDTWEFVFPLNVKEPEPPADQTRWISWPYRESYMIESDDGTMVKARVYASMPAEELWQIIMKSTYDFAEPGFLMVDRLNRENNNWWCEILRATNPCGEQPLPPFGACLLGSINLTKFVVNPFTPEAYFDFESFGEVVRVFTRMLDNVVELNGLPLRQQQEEIWRKRRQGKGFFGLGSALTMLCIPYNSTEAENFTERVSFALCLEGWREGVALAKEKGPAPIMNEEFLVSWEDSRGLVEHGSKEKVTGKRLFMRSLHLQRLFDQDPNLKLDMGTYGCRFTHHTSIAPTGTIALSFGNNASNGIEPTFAHSYTRNIIVEGKKSKATMEVVSYELLKYRQLVDPLAGKPGAAALPSYFTVTDNLAPVDHVRIQAAAQRWVDSSISKTINVPTDLPFEDFQQVYKEAYAQGLKGCTTFRFNPAAFQGVLVKDADLENTVYDFTLEDGSVVSAKGNDTIIYDGESHSAANLFDAIKEGYYGKF